MNTTMTLRDAVTEYIRRALIWFEEWRAAERAEADQLKADGYTLVTYRDRYRDWMLPDGPCGYQPRRLDSTVVTDYFTAEVLSVQVAASENDDLSASARIGEEWEVNRWAPYGDGFDVEIPDTPPFTDLGLTERQASDIAELVTDGCAEMIVALTGMPGMEVTRALADWDGRWDGLDYSYSEHRPGWLTALAETPADEEACG
jgi:hypothetical protein